MKFLVMLLALALLVPAAPADAQMLMNGAGATFPYPIYSKWFEEYIKVDRKFASTISRSAVAAASGRSPSGRWTSGRRTAP